MRKLLFFTIFCLFLVVSLAEAQRSGGTRVAQPRSAQSKVTVMESPHSIADTSKPNDADAVAKSDMTDLTHGRNHVLLIGVNDYLPSADSTESMLSVRLRNLRFCRKDMEGMQDALVKARFCKAKDIRILVSGGENEPTKNNVEKALLELGKNIQHGDRVLIAFSGHGIALDHGNDLKTDYICCADTQVVYNASAGNFDTMEGLIDRAWLELELDKTDADLKILFFDACRNELGNLSGIVKSVDQTQSVAGTRSPFANFGVGSVDVKTGYSVGKHVKQPKLYRFSSGMAGTESQEFAGEIEHGVFTYFLIKGMLGDAPQYTAGKITLHDLSEYVRRETQKFVTARIPGATQTPNGVALPIDKWHPDEVVFSYPYTPGLEPEPEPESEPVRNETTLVAQEETLPIQGPEPEPTPASVQEPEPEPMLAPTVPTLTRAEQQRLQREQQQEERRQQEQQRQQELRRQQEIIAQRYMEEFSGFERASASRLQEIDDARFRQNQQEKLREITRRINNFNETKPQTEQGVNAWNQAGQKLQRDIDAWMTRTNPVVIASSRTQLSFNQSESAAARRAAGYTAPGGSGNRNGAGR